MAPLFSELVDLKPAPGADGPDQFVAAPPGEGFLFGGLTMALGLQAAGRTAEAGFVAKSIHSLFLRPGNWGPELRLDVTRTNDSRTFALRRVTITQAGKTLAEITAFLHRPEPGEDRQHAPAPDVPPPTWLEPATPLLPVAGIMEVRPVNPFDRAASETTHPYWAKFSGLSPDPWEHSLAVAFVSDYMVIFTPFPKDSTWGKDLVSRTLSHSLWFHRPPGDGWLLLSSSPLNVGDGRFTSSGTAHDEDGQLIASFVQEGYLRPQPSPAGTR